MDPNNTKNLVENTLVEVDGAVATDATAADAAMATDVRKIKAEQAAGTSLITAAAGKRVTSSPTALRRTNHATGVGKSDTCNRCAN